jgi:hypothetical protein
MRINLFQIYLIILFSLLLSSQIDNELTSIPCGDCHSSGGWEKLTYSNFFHNETGFQLNGVHKIQKCNDCHLGNSIEEKHDFQFENNNCNSCHIDIHLQELGNDCEQCHNENSWDVDERKFNHNQTRFPLIKGHQNINCNECHINTTSQFSLISTECKSCHIDDYIAIGTGQYSNAPSHITMQYSQNCQDCHSISTWKGAGFNHDETGFILSGAHQLTDCEQCHSGGNYNLPNSCEGCHAENGNASTNSTQSNYDHNTHLINQDCEQCHNDLDWENNLFQHSDFTGNDCEECHQPEYIESENPPHGNGNINDNCSLCHESTNEWTIDPFIHSLIQTSYELNGLHLTANCESCHATQQYNNTYQECESCHLQDYEQTENPNHQQYQYPDNYCNLCHETLGWEPDIFMHMVNDACESCHIIDHENATNPDHSQLPTNCINCHTDISTWEGAEFDHGDISDNCNSCHETDYELAENPSHEGLSTQCEDCHNSTENWNDANFSHNNIIDNCFSCHENEYNDEHNTDFPTSCETCHEVNDWDDLNYNHDNDYFPIYNGEHRSEWNSCTAECHIVSDDFSQFSCGLNGVCHEHRQSEMDGEHRGENGYVYESSACFDCHPDGEEDDIIINNFHNRILKRAPWNILKDINNKPPK